MEAADDAEADKFVVELELHLSKLQVLLFAKGYLELCVLFNALNDCLCDLCILIGMVLTIELKVLLHVFLPIFVLFSLSDHIIGIHA